MTFTKDYAVGFIQADLDIPIVLLNFVGGQTGHSKCIMDLVGEWFEHNTAVCVRFCLKWPHTIYRHLKTKGRAN